jgi:hypothetical protein
MTLSEIELTLTELVSRHPNLDLELLRTLLLAAGWEDKNIQEAVTLFKQKGIEGLKGTHDDISESSQVQALTVEPVVDTQVPQTEITFYQPDGTEEGKLQAFTESPSNHKPEEKKESDEKKDNQPNPVLEVEVAENTKEQVFPEISLDAVDKEEKQDTVQTNVTPKEEKIEDLAGAKEEDIAQAITFEEIATQKKEDAHDEVIQQPKEPQSLIITEPTSVAYVPKKDVQIPEDLPLLPFESSPHVWSFSKYKDTFHGDTLSETKTPNPPASVQKEQSQISPIAPQPQVTPQVPTHIPVEVDGEKVPMNKSDESLVFLAGIMLLAIILILGYMYSNGRL